MKSISRLIFEAVKKKPSALKKFNITSEDKDKLKYYSGKGDGYIIDKNGNVYDVKVKYQSSNEGLNMGWGRIDVTITGAVNGNDIKFQDESVGERFWTWELHYKFLSLKTDIIEGTYLEDYIARHWDVLYTKNSVGREALEKIKSNGDPNAPTYDHDKKSREETKRLEFYSYHLFIPNVMPLYVTNGEVSIDEDKLNWYRVKNLYKKAKLEELLSREEEVSLHTRALAAMKTILLPQITKSLNNILYNNLSKMSGIYFDILITPNLQDFAANAIDIKKNVLTIVNLFDHKDYRENDASNCEIRAITFVKNKANDYTKELFKRAARADQKDVEKDEREKYAEEMWTYWQYDYWEENKRRLTKGQSKQLARKKFKPKDKDIIYDSNEELTYNFTFLKDFIKDNPQTKETKVDKDVKPSSKSISDAESKMDAWHAGTRGQNVQKSSDSKLKLNYKICVSKGYDKEAALLKAEAEKRGLTLESKLISLYEYILNE